MKNPFFAAAGAALLLLGAIAYFASALEGRVQRHASVTRIEVLGGLQRSAEVELELFDLKGGTANYLLTGDARWKTASEKRWRELETALGRARETAASDPARRSIERIAGLCLECRRVSQQAMAAHDAGRSDEARALAVDDLMRLTGELRVACDESLRINQQIIDTATAETLSGAAGLRWATWGAVAAIGVAAAASGWWVSRLAAGRRQDAELGEIGRLMSSFLAHEVRNPLSVLGMRLHALDREVASDSAREDVAVMKGVVARLDGTIAGFLEFAATAAPTPTESRVRDLIDQAVDGVRPILDATHVTVEIDAGDELVARVDPRQVRMALQNLILNSAQAMPEGGVVRIVGRQGRNEKGRTQLEILVSDTGTGLPEHVRENLYKPFVSGRPDGIGLGLTISHRLARLNGGQLGLETSGSEGTSFRISLPGA